MNVVSITGKDFFTLAIPDVKFFDYLILIGWMLANAGDAMLE